MERYHSPRIAETAELDGLSLPGEVSMTFEICRSVTVEKCRSERPRPHSLLSSFASPPFTTSSRPRSL